MDTLLSNRILLPQIRTMTIDEIAALPVGVLADLASDAAQMKKLATSDADKIGIALDVKYGRRANEARKAEGKDTGVVRVADGEFVVICDIPKRVEWDQPMLHELGNRIAAAGEDAHDYIDQKLSISETRYHALPPHLRQPFDAARTVKPGKPSYAIEKIEG